MSTLLIAACYWKRANDWGAGAAIVVGQGTATVVTQMAADRLRMASNLLDGKSQGSLAAQYLDDANYAALRGIDLLDELEAKP